MKKALFLYCLFPIASTFVYSQQRLPINTAIAQSWEYIENQLPRNARIQLYPLNLAFGGLARYIADEVTSRCINSRKLTIVEQNREILQIIEQETNYQLSGEVSDETMISIGKRLGTEYFAFFNIQNIGDRYILNLRITNIERGELRGQKNIILEQDQLLLSFITRTSQNLPQRILDINDLRKIFIFGYEIIETRTGELLNRTTTTRNGFRNISIENNLIETRTTLPNIFSSAEQINLDDTIDYILSNKNMFSVQYILLFVSRTNIMEGNERYNIPTRLVASCDFVLIDFNSNQIVYSDTIDTNGFLFELPNLNEITIINESIKAFRFLFNKSGSQNINLMFSNIVNGL